VRRARQALPLVVAAALIAWTVVGAAVVGGGRPAAAQQPPASGASLVLPVPSATAPGSAVSGAPAVLDPNTSVRLGPEPLVDCGRDLPCRVRLRGVLGKNGAIAVEGTAFTW
jgi:hypothetical protein